MVKKPDIKTRKKLRITMCVLYLLEIVICTMPFFQDVKFNEDGIVTMASPFNMLMILFGVTSPLDASIISICVICMALIVVPMVGFLFCALDKQRNLKNIVSVLCCLTGVLLIAIMLGNERVRYMSIGAVLAILVYILIMFLTSIAMVMRLSKDEEDVKEPKKKKVRKEDRIY